MELKEFYRNKDIRDLKDAIASRRYIDADTKSRMIEELESQSELQEQSNLYKVDDKIFADKKTAIVYSYYVALMSSLGGSSRGIRPYPVDQVDVEQGNVNKYMNLINRNISGWPEDQQQEYLAKVKADAKIR